MPRPLRILYPNAWYHVMNRGSGKRNIFTSNLHRTMYLNLLKEAQMMFNVKIHAYCLMDNHYHVLLSTPEANLARVMRHINGIYTQRYNRYMKTDGPLFRGRYKAQIVEEGLSQLIVSRYIHLNPVRAKIVDHAFNYKCSSYRAYIGMDKVPTWLCVDEILKQFPEVNVEEQIENYRRFMGAINQDNKDTETNIDLKTTIIGSKYSEKNSYRELILK